MSDNPLNPFATPTAKIAQVEQESQRAIAETQAAVVMAKRFPRDSVAAMDRILQAFTRPGLAEAAQYSYVRAGTEVTGPSIRSAEAIAQLWGNMQFGIRELEQRSAESTVQAFAWDLETNTRREVTFVVPHVRDTKQGPKVLKDSRGIYEMVANQGARRLRACILAVIPGDVIDAAMQQVSTTLATKAQATPERIVTLVEKFAALGVTKQMLEKRLQRRVEVITPALIISLGRIYNSIKDGMSGPQDWFEVGDVDTGQASGIARPKRKPSADAAAQSAPAANPTDNGWTPTPEEAAAIKAREEAEARGE